MSQEAEILRLAASMLTLGNEDRMQCMRHVGLACAPTEVEILIQSLREGSKLRSHERNTYEIEALETLGKMVELAADEKERAKLALLYQGATSRETAVPGRGVNGVLPSAYSSKNIRTPLGRLIEANEVEQLAAATPGGHPSYFLTQQGARSASDLARSLAARIEPPE